MSTSAPRLPDALEALRDRLDEAPLHLDVPGRDDASRAARAVVDQVDDYLLPRLRDLDAPLLAVVGGSTGAGKSTLVNSLLGAHVTTAGVLRPTTRAPVLVCSPADRDAFAGDRVLPGLARTTGEGEVTGGLRLLVSDALPPGLAVLDAPDVDSVVETNRELAGQLLAAADLWIFVTTAARYADAVPWELLRTAQERGTALAVVLDRVPPEATREIADDLTGMLRAAGLSGARLFVVEERPLNDGLLPEDQVEPLRTWLHGLAADQEQRAAVVRQTLAGALDSLDARVDAVVQAVVRQAEAADALRAGAEAAYERACTSVSDGVAGGALLRGEVLARWQEFVGTGEWMRTLQGQVGRLRDRITATLTGRPSAGAGLQQALESGVEVLLRDAADEAAERTVTAWRGTPGGPGLLAGRQAELEAAAPEFPERASAEVRNWQGAVLDLVRSEGAGKRTRARTLSWGVNGAGAVVMVAVFASTGGLTGGEVAVAGGTTAVGQRVLEAVFGDSAVRALAARARKDLEQRTDRLLTGERQRFDALVDAAAPPPGSIDDLRAAAAELSAARRAQR
ncbi:GTPase domain-containing protein [Blastococcus sp. CCUG 61487]|uniref:GTPase domain-containing protein n=1 Tax=Blastococcus sp. CCUG 61487 TaxID=1840703 RepID=UPI0010C0A00D|nr:GTPase domain-containing protein [Blastococcus sp. CCUG 61487]